MMRRKQFILTGTSPAAAGKSELARIEGLSRFSFFQFDAFLQGATGGTLDIYLQRSVFNAAGANVWIDWCHFTQFAAGGAAAVYTLSTIGSSSIATVGTLSDDLTTGSLVLAANTFVGGHPGDKVRIVAVAGASTSAGAAQTVYITGL